MTWIYVYETEAIELALERLREDGIVWQDPSVDDDAPESRKRGRRRKGRCPLPSEPGRSSQTYTPSWRG